MSSPDTADKRATLLQRACEMRNAIDAIEMALMGYGDLVEMPRVWESASGEQVIHPRVTVEQMRQVCNALAECTRIINSTDHTAQSLSALQRTEWQPIETAPTDGTTILGFWINGEQHTGSICEGKWCPAWEQENEWAMPSHWKPLDEPEIADDCGPTPPTTLPPLRERKTFDPREAGFTLKQEPEPKESPAGLKGHAFD